MNKAFFADVEFVFSMRIPKSNQKRLRIWKVFSSLKFVLLIFKFINLNSKQSYLRGFGVLGFWGFGMFLVCFWYAFGMLLVCFWYVFGMCLVCFLNVFGMLLV